VRSVKLARTEAKPLKQLTWVSRSEKTGLKVLTRVKILLPGRIAENQEGLTGLERSR
jgi:hypothetical protein